MAKASPNNTMRNFTTAEIRDIINSFPQLATLKSALKYFINSIPKSNNTKESYRIDLNTFRKWLELTGLRYLSLKPKDITKFIGWSETKKWNRQTKQKGLSRWSINRILSAVRMFYEFLQYMGVPIFNPVIPKWHRFKGGSLPKRVSNPPSEGVIRKLLDGVTNLRDKAIFEFYRASGARLEEILNANEEHLNFLGELNEKDEVTLYGELKVKGKGGKERTVYLDADASLAYLKYLKYDKPKNDNPALFPNKKGERISRRGAQDRLTFWQRKLKLPHFSMHKLRHAFGHRMKNYGMLIKDIRDLLGHKDISTTEIYLPRNKELKEAYIQAVSKDADSRRKEESDANKDNKKGA